MPNIVKNTTFIGPLDLIFPHSCRGCGHTGEVLCERCKNYIKMHRQDLCPQCKNPRSSSICKNCPDLPPIYAVSNRDGLLGELVHDYKYHSIRALALPLAELLSSVLPANLPNNAKLIPLPTATHHIRSRGFDHTLLLAKKLSKLRNLPVERLLERNKNTVQVGSDRSTRLSQADSAYKINPKFKIDQNATYILLDDIWTTGASTLSAMKKLKQKGAQNIMICLLAYSV